MARWLSDRFNVKAIALRDLGLRDSEDVEIFKAARAANAVLISKDVDFVELVDRLGPPPQLLWLTCGNASNERLKELFGRVFQKAREMIENGIPIVEIADK